MKFSCLTPMALLAIVSLLGATSDAVAQKSDQAPLITKVYRVSDLVMPTPNYAFRGVQLPGLDRSGRIFGGGGGGGFGGMGGGGFGVGGGGAAGGPAASAPATPSSGFRFSISDLIATIATTVEPETWNEVGGPGAISTLGSMLVIRQTLQVHEQVREFLDSLRELGGAITSVTIEAHWLLLDNAQRARLMRADDRSQQVVDRSVLAELAAKSGARGQITCFDGQTVHLISGNIRSSVISVVPVVGQRDEAGSPPAFVQHITRPADAQPDVAESTTIDKRHYLAQAVSGAAAEPAPAPSPHTHRTNVGYSPITQVVNYGALLQVTPALISDSNALVLDVRSIVIRPQGDAVSPVAFGPVASLQRLNMVVQQFMTTLRIPLRRPVLLAGSTWEPIPDQGKDQQLYLVIEASLASVKPGAD